MSEFQTYFTLGYQHILDWQGYDHMIFLLALVAPFSIMEGKKILLLITAFTIGHSVSLVLSTFNLVNIDSDLIELLIPVTILVTALINITVHEKLKNTHFFIVVFFGLIHGVGFSGYLKSLLGFEENIVVPLLSFNVGLEIGQIIFSALLMFILVIMSKALAFKLRTSNLLLSGTAGLVSIFLIIERF